MDNQQTSQAPAAAPTAQQATPAPQQSGTKTKNPCKGLALFSIIAPSVNIGALLIFFLITLPKSAAIDNPDLYYGGRVFGTYFLTLGLMSIITIPVGAFQLITNVAALITGIISRSKLATVDASEQPKCRKLTTFAMILPIAGLLALIATAILSFVALIFSLSKIGG